MTEPKTATHPTQSKRRSENLSDSYIKSLLCRDGTPRELIPQELIEMKREQLQIYRLTRQLEQVIKEKQEENQRAEADQHPG